VQRSSESDNVRHVDRIAGVLPLSALDERLAIVGTSGSGKTYAAKGLVERLMDRGGRVCVVDPLGVWWGLLPGLLAVDSIVFCPTRRRFGSRWRTAGVCHDNGATGRF
jgi:Helicase HerA, central domain